MNLHLYGQEVNPETWAICTGDMLIKGEKDIEVVYGSTLSHDAFPGKEFDFMLTNPPYGKSWKNDVDAIVSDRGKKNKEQINDPRFTIGLPTISDGQLLFLSNMVHKMKQRSELGSRIASVHNGSSLFTGDAGSGESEIRRHIIENDLLECIIALPQNIFYNTGIPTYIWVLSNRKPEHRQGKVQLMNALNLYQPLRRNLGQKNCELSQEHIDQITQLYLDFQESDMSKIFDNQDFGYWKITIERPLRLKSRFTQKAVDSLRFLDALRAEMEWIYAAFGEAVYDNAKQFKDKIVAHCEKQDVKLTPANRKKLLNSAVWNERKQLMEIAAQLRAEIGDQEYDDFHRFGQVVEKALKTRDLKLSASDKKTILMAVSWKDEAAQPVIKKKEKDGTIVYEADSDLRDSENVPLHEDIQAYFEREVLPYVPDAWIDHEKTAKGYSISFTRYFYSYTPPRDLKDIKQEILQLERETEGILKELVDEES